MGSSRGEWWFKFEFGKWRNDTALRRCSLTTRGFWIDCICAMREAGVSELSGSPEEIARLLGCFPEEVTRCAEELKRTNTADVTLGNDCVTLKSRYIARERKVKELTKLRVRKHRQTDECNAAVTIQSKSKSKSKTSEDTKNVSSEGEEPNAPPPEKAPPSDFAEATTQRLLEETGKILRIDLPLEAKKTVADQIPPALADEWIRFVKGRRLAVPETAAPGFVLAKLGYWLTDFRRENKGDYEKLASKRQRLQTPDEKEAEIAAAFANGPRNDPKQFWADAKPAPAAANTVPGVRPP